MNRKTILLYTTALCVTVGSIFSLNTNAATTFISKGRVEDPSGNVIFDVDDLKSLDTKITQLDTSLTQLETNFDNGKDQILEELEKNPNIDITNPDPSFPDIVQYIKQMTNIPADTYFYEKGTEGSTAIVRYKKVGGKYYKCDANGKVAQGAQEVNVSGKQLEDYAATKAGNLSAGAAGYANGGFYLGDGSDNAAYQNQNRVGTAVAADVLAGKTFSNSTGSGLTGTMVNRGTLNWNPTSNATQTVQPGYYSGGTLNSAGAYNKGKTDGAAASKVGNVAPGQVLEGKTFTNASTVGATGTMPNKGAWTNAPTTKGKVTIPAGYHNGSGYVDTSGVYAKGYTDGKAEAVGSANITYTYHKHTGSATTGGGCYTSPVYHSHTSTCNGICPLTVRYVSEGTSGTVKVTCDNGHIGYRKVNSQNQIEDTACSATMYVCGKTGVIESYSLSCGKDTSTIESATITY